MYTDCHEGRVTMKSAALDFDEELTPDFCPKNIKVHLSQILTIICIIREAKRIVQVICIS